MSTWNILPWTCFSYLIETDYNTGYIRRNTLDFHSLLLLKYVKYKSSSYVQFPVPPLFPPIRFKRPLVTVPSFFLNVMMIKMAEYSPASLEVRRMFSRHPHCRHLRSAAGGIKSTELQAADFLRSSSSRPKTTEQLPGTAGNSDGVRGFCYCRDCCCG